MDLATGAVRTRLRLGITKHIQDADKGCDCEFLRTDLGAPVAEPVIYLRSVRHDRAHHVYSESCEAMVPELMKSPAELIEVEQRLIKEGVSDSQNIAKLTVAALTAACEPGRHRTAPRHMVAGTVVMFILL